MKINVLADAKAVAAEAAKFIAAEARMAVTVRGQFVFAISGGHTPWQMLRALATEEVPWKNVHIVQVDERVAPAGHADRNLTHLCESLLEQAPLRPEQIYALPVEEKDLDAAAASYARRPGLRHHRRGRGDDGGLPGPAADDADVSDAEPVAAHLVAGDRRGQS
jgi:6-phosphogluconolactonase